MMGHIVEHKMQWDVGVESEIISILGLRARIRKVDFNTIEQLILRGIPYSSFRRLKKELKLSEEELARAIGMDMRELSLTERLSARLPLVPSDRLYRIARIFALAIRVFEEKESAADWLRRPQPALGGRTAFNALLTEPGADEVENLLGRIEYGVIS
jgi:putative toxin-antitoxin system antitoxin component (TIGR02293 family)